MTSNKDGAVVLDEIRGQMFLLNPTAIFVLDHFQHGLSEEEITEEVANRYCVSKTVARRDIREFLQALAGSAVLQMRR
jgi:hypothetical protein